MEEQDALTIAAKGLDMAFSSLDKEVKGFKLMLDVSPRSLNRIIKDKAIARKTRIELINALGHSYMGAEDNFIALSSSFKLNRAEKIIAENVGSGEVTDQLLNTRRTARKTQFLKKSRQAGARLKQNVDTYLSEISKFTSPTLIAKVKIDAAHRKDNLTISMDIPTNVKYRGLDKLALTAIGDGIKYAESTEIQAIFRSKVDLLEDTLRKGRTRVQTKKLTKTLKQKQARKASDYQYYDSFVEDYGYSEDERDTHFSIMSTLRVLLSPRVGQPPHMQPSSFPPNTNYLRYQTGRFANSAEILNVTPDIDISYTYRHNPYDVFQGGTHGKGRDPEFIIEGAIRALMQQFYTNVRIRSLIPE